MHYESKLLTEINKTLPMIDSDFHSGAYFFIAENGDYIYCTPWWDDNTDSIQFVKASHDADEIPLEEVSFISSGDLQTDAENYIKIFREFCTKHKFEV